MIDGICGAGAAEVFVSMTIFVLSVAHAIW
jgi:hypothetical protein